MVNPIVFAESQQLTNAGAIYYTSPTQTTSVVKKVTLTNTDGSNGFLVTIWVVPIGQTATTPYVIRNQKPIGPGETQDVTEMVNQILKGGDFIAAMADTGAKINIRISGVQVT